MAILIDLEKVSASRPGRPLFDSLSIALSGGDRLGVVGFNGSGKSTLLRIMAGLLQPESGVVRRGRGVRIGFLSQRPTLASGTVRAAVGESWEASAILDLLKMTPLTEAPVETLSGGQAKRVALAQVLMAENDLLILDEPTNHLDLGAIVWLEARLAAFRGGLVVVSHDRHVLDRVTTRMLEIDRGNGYLHEGGYASYLEARSEREDRAAAAEVVRRNLARRELAWLRRGAPARTRKPQARIDAALAIVEGRPAAAVRPSELALDAFGTPRLGDKVVELDGVGYRYDTGDVLFHDIELRLDPRARLGVVGPNGSGKSTLLDILAGQRSPSWGTVEVGPTAQIGYYDQRGVDLNPDARVRDLVAGPARAPGSPEDLRLMDRFWFGGETQWATVGTLSGGERRRLQLLLALAARPNVLLLDEPTNDLDLDTLRSLEDFLEEWPGALVVVSHDRAFLERSVVDVLALDGRGGAGPVAGGVPAWVAAATAGALGAPVSAASVPRGRPGGAPAGRGGSAGPVGSPGRRPSGGRPSGGRPSGGRASGGLASDPSTSRRSPSTLRRLLLDAERQMKRLEKRRGELESAMAAASSDHEALARIGSELAILQEDLSELEEQWLALAEEAEGS
ncbi:MAG TPA: ABC-F family ATP-binding cassette domain-containing protein [Acidimicrobiales bacterium]